MGESVVSGEITPDSFVVHKKEMAVESRSIGQKTKMVVYGEKGTVFCDVPPEAAGAVHRRRRDTRNREGRQASRRAFRCSAGYGMGSRQALCLSREHFLGAGEGGEIYEKRGGKGRAIRDRPYAAVLPKVGPWICGSSKEGGNRWLYFLQRTGTWSRTRRRNTRTSSLANIYRPWKKRGWDNRSILRRGRRRSPHCRRIDNERSPAWSRRR